MQRCSVVVLWSPGAISVREMSLSGEAELWNGKVPSAIGTHRYDLALYPGSALSLRVPGGSRAPFLRLTEGGRVVQPVEPVPGKGPISPGRCRVHRNGTLTVIEDHQLWIRPPSVEMWLCRKLPESLRVHDLSIDAHGHLFAAGEMPLLEPAPQNAAGSEAALFMLDSDQALSVQFPMSDSDRQTLVKYGGAEAFRRVDVEGSPYVLTSSCAWMFEDPSDFLFMGEGGKWRVRRLERQFIRTWLREGTETISVFTVQGRRHRTHDHGATWEECDLMKAIRAAWKTKHVGSYSVTAVASSGIELAMIVACHNWRVTDGNALQGSAVLTSNDDGNSFSIQSETLGPEKEFLSLVFSG